jgi:LysM repeat protein
MAPRSLARWLAPLALVGALVAVVSTVSSSTSDDSGSSGSGATETAPRRTSTVADEEREQPRRLRTYTVQQGDILSTVAEKTGVSVERLQELNPGIDANALSIGQKLRLSAP